MVASQLTLHGSGRTKAAGAEFEFIYRRCTSPLAFHALARPLGERN